MTSIHDSCISIEGQVKKESGRIGLGEPVSAKGGDGGYGRLDIISFRRSAAERGYTIIDTLIALVILIAAVVVLIGVIPYSFGQIEYDSVAVQAGAVGQQLMDQVRYDVVNAHALPASPTTAPIDFGDSFRSGTAVSGVSGNFSLTNSCSALNGSTLTDDCTVTVSWTENNEPRQITLETYVTEQI